MECIQSCRNIDKIGIIVGRFQIDFLHEGYRALINHVIKEKIK